MNKVEVNIEKAQKKYVRNYYAIAILLNVVLPILFAIAVIGNKKGEIQLGYVFVGIWGLICTIVYCFYFAIPEFKRHWKKIAGLLFPTLILSLLLLIELNLVVVLLPNLIINGFFIWHLEKRLANQANSSPY